MAARWSAFVSFVALTLLAACGAFGASEDPPGNNKQPAGGDDASADARDGASASADASDAALDLCGNGHVDPGEACDDGNRVNGDGCSNQCTID